MDWKEYVKACIFDLDGVIVDTAKYHFKAWQELGKKFGFDFDEEFNEKLKGVSRADSLSLILEAAGQTLDEQAFQVALNEKNNHYLHLIDGMNKSEILPGVLPFLTILAKNNIQIGLGSASKNARIILQKVELTDFFDIISDGTTIEKGKPDPEVFLACSAYFGLDPINCVVFEDSLSGIKAATNGGFTSVGIGNIHTLIGAQVVYKNFREFSPEDLFELYI